MLTEREIHASLSSMGILPTDTVLVHTSMRAVGPVEGGCDGLIDAFLSYLTEGLFLVPTHTWDNVTREAPFFDVRQTPPCIGALPRVAARRTDGVRSLHPTHSVAAFGRSATAYAARDRYAATPCPRQGCFAGLLDRRAKILLLGVGLNRYTFIHAVDEMLDLPGKLAEPFTVTVKDADGQTFSYDIRPHGNTGSAHFGNYEDAFYALHALTYGRLGEARVRCLDAVGTEAALRLLHARADYDYTEKEGMIPARYWE